MPRNSLVNGKTAPDSFGTQLDEGAYPILMAQQLGLTDAALYANHIKPAANFVAAHGPSFGVERWEEQSGYSPSTIAAAIAGLVAAADIARANGDTTSAAIWLGVADDWQRSIKGWTVTTNGPLGAALLHPPLEGRRPERGDHLQRRQRRADARPALGDRRRLPRARAPRRAAGERPGRARVAAGRRREDQVERRRAGRAGTATTATATATARATAGRGRRAARARATSGRRCRPSAASSRSRPATRRRRRRCSRHERVRVRRRPRSPSRTGRLPISPASPYGTDPTLASIGFKNGGAAGLGLAAHVVGGVVRPARGRPRRGPERRCCRRSRPRAT